jgi:TPR repeat protein
MIHDVHEALSAAASTNDPQAQYQLAVFYLTYDPSNLTQGAIDQLEKAATQSHVPAMKLLAKMFYDQGVAIIRETSLTYNRQLAKDPSYVSKVYDGIDLLMKSAKLENLDAHHALGLTFLRGAAEQKTDVNQAESWLALASSKGHVDSTLTLASLYANLPEDDKRHPLSEEVREVAANQGSLTAQLELSEIKPSDTKERIEKAMHWREQYLLNKEA